MIDCLIVGGGISGLTCAYKLQQLGRSVRVIESSDRPGGLIQSTRQNGYLLEAGPNSLRIDNEETDALLQLLGLDKRELAANPNSNERYILRNGKLIAIPRSPSQLLTSPFLSPIGKLSFLREPLVKKTLKKDPTIFEFVSRRFSLEVAEYLADPMVTGVFAGDIRKLSMSAAFPKFFELEQTFGSLIRGMIAGRKKTKSFKPRIISFPDGIEELIRGLAEKLGPRISIGEPLRSIFSDGGLRGITSKQSIPARSIVLTCPAHSIDAFGLPISKTLQHIEYAPIAVVYLGYERNAIAHSLSGFGVLTPRLEEQSVLGCLFSSSVFPGRAPKGHILLTLLLGGTRNPGLIERDKREIISEVIRFVTKYLGATKPPAFSESKLWKHGIPQYNVGHAEIMSKIDAYEAENKGIYLLGNYRGGISVTHCIKNATLLAQKIHKELS